MTESVSSKDNDAYGEGAPENVDEREPSKAAQLKGLGRKEKRKALKKEKRKQIRKEVAEKARSEEEARLNDPEEQRRIQLEEEQEKERLERERREYVERERIFLEELERERKEEEEEERRNAFERESRQNQAGEEQDSDEDDKWEYVEEGPPEIIWQGHEIIVKKNKVRVKKKDAVLHIEKEDPNRPTSNPLPPQSEAYAAYKNESMTSAQLLDSVAQQVPNFGTEQDKAHCPFHIKTGACRFGLRCNRIHYYPDISCTLLIKNMYNGPGLAWEQDEGLEYTDEEVERNYEEFYNDVHNEFLKFGEIINFKVCRNGSFHLRGNVYVHYKSMDSAVMAYNSQHGRYYAGKQVNCEFVNLTKWKVAICGEYMKSRLTMCSRGTACNFLHCFSNPGGEYEWADCDKPPPRYWVQKMIALFGYSDESWCDKQMELPSPRDRLNSSRILTSDGDSYYRKRNRSLETDRYSRSFSRSYYEEDDMWKRRYHERWRSNSRKQTEPVDEKNYDEEKGYKRNHHHNGTTDDTDSDGNLLDREGDRDVRRTRCHGSSRSNSRHEREESKSRADHRSRKRFHFTSSDEDLFKSEKDMERHHGRARKRSRHKKNVLELSGSDGESNDTKLEEQRRHSSSEPSEVDFSGHKEKNRNSSRHHRRNITHSRSRRHDSDEGVGEVCYRESENELFPNKQERYKRKSTFDKNAGSRGSHRYSRSRSRDSGYFSDKHNDESDRWEPDESTPERLHGRSNSTVIGEDQQQVSVGSQSYDQTFDDAFTTRNRKHSSRSSSCARHLGSLEDESSCAEEFKNLEESSGNSHHEKMRNHKAREKKKRI